MGPGLQGLVICEGFGDRYTYVSGRNLEVCLVVVLFHKLVLEGHMVLHN